MLASVGQALREARLKMNLSIEEVSRATKIRAARIADLENDDYLRFPNITYARSFLLLYAKFLRVDLSKYPIVEAGSTVGLADYQYLQSHEEPPAQRTRQEPKGPPEKPRWLITFFVLLTLLALVALAGWYVIKVQRLGSVENFAKKESPTALATPSPTPVATPAPEAPAALRPPAATPPPAPVAVPAAEVMPPPLNLPASPQPTEEVRRAEPIMTASSDAAVLAAAAAATPALTAPAEAAVFPPPGAVREINVRATKRVRVRIVRDTPKSSSLYYGSLNPAQPTLAFKGKYFWIKTTDPEALQVTIDGHPVTAAPEAGVEIIPSPGL